MTREEILSFRLPVSEAGTPEGEALYSETANAANQWGDIRIAERDGFYITEEVHFPVFPETLQGYTQEEQRERLYEELRYRAVNDDITQGLTDEPLSETGLSADECRDKYVKHIGEEEKAKYWLGESMAIKEYIKSLVLYDEPAQP